MTYILIFAIVAEAAIIGRLCARVNLYRKYKSMFYRLHCDYVGLERKADAIKKSSIVSCFRCHKFQKASKTYDNGTVTLCKACYEKEVKDAMQA